MIRAVLFDIDDTLVDTRGAFRHALSTVAARYLSAAPSPDELTLTWRTDAGGHYRAFTRGEIGYREQRMRRANELHVIYGGPVLDDDAYDEWNEGFERAFQEGWLAHEDVTECLDALDAAGIAYGALSNAAVAYQEAKLAAAGLERVPMLVGVDTLGFGKPDPTAGQSKTPHPFRGKPDPEVFWEACRLIGFAPGEVVYVGDEFDIDGVGALDAGLQSVWLARRGTEAHYPDDERLAEARARGLMRISTLDELPPLLCV